MGKTELIIFGSKNKLKKVQNFSITCYGQTIRSSNAVKYLGLHLNQTLSGQETVNSIIKKTNARLKFMYRQVRHVGEKTKKTLCSSLILSHFDYCVSSWYYGLTKKCKDKLQSTQNRVVKFIMNKDLRYRVTQADLERLNMLNVENRVNQLCINHVFKIFHDECPKYMYSNFTKLSNVHQYNVRGSNFNFHVPRINHVLKSSFFYNAIKLWNGLPSNVKSTSGKETFKSHLKKYLTDCERSAAISSSVHY